MPSLSELPSDLPRRKLIRALERLDFLIDKTGGRGSHCKVTCPKSKKMVIIPQKLSKKMLYVVLKEIEIYEKITWQDIDKEL